MYKCKECGREYEELPKSGELYIFEDTLKTHELTTNDCGCGGELCELFECEVCGDMTFEEDCFCIDCKKKTYSRVKRLIDFHIYDGSMNQKQIDFINNEMINDLDLD